jgi:hypothetical protein
MKYLCTSTSQNTKTGNVPGISIGDTRADSLQSCRDVACPLLHKKHGGQGGDGNPICYAQHGTPSFAHSSRVKASANGKDYSLSHALEQSSRAAKMVRVGVIGDPAALSPIDGAYIRQTIKRAGLALVGYTHGWELDTAQHWRGSLMASCETLEQADKAIADGWRATVLLPSDQTARTFDTPDGHTGVVCPAILKPEIVTCNSCRLCDGSKAGPVIGFPDHGPGKGTNLLIQAKQAARRLRSLEPLTPSIGDDDWVSPLKRRLQVAIPPIHEPEKYVLCSNGCGKTHHEDYAHHPCQGGE